MTIRTTVQVNEVNAEVEGFGTDREPMVDVILKPHGFAGEIRLVCKSLDDVDKLADALDDAAVWFKQRETRYGIRSVQ